MIDEKRWQWRRACAWLAPASAVGAVLIACGPKPPPPHVVEIPIDQFQAAPGPVDAGALQAPVLEVQTTEAPAVEVAAGGSHPAPIAAAAPPTAIPPGQRLTAAECSRLVDRGAILYGVAQGMTGQKAAHAVASLRSQAQADGTFAHVKSSCSESNSKPQYSCSVTAKTFDKWKACVE